MATVTVKAIQRRLVSFQIVGLTTMIQHQWSEKAKEAMRKKHRGTKTKDRSARDPQKEFEDATYRTTKGEYGIPVSALKTAVIGAAHKDIGIEKTLVRKALFIHCDDSGGVIAMDCDAPEIVEDTVRVGQGSADLRYRPYFHRWAVNIVCEIDEDLLTVETLCILVNRAGFGVGIGEWRPEKGGEHGRFEINSAHKIRVTNPSKKEAK